MDNLLLLAFPILGSALIAGGIVGYRRGKTTNVKVLSAIAVAVGITLWIMTLWVTLVSVTRGQ